MAPELVLAVLSSMFGLMPFIAWYTAQRAALRVLADLETRAETDRVSTANLRDQALEYFEEGEKKRRSARAAQQRAEAAREGPGAGANGIEALSDERIPKDQRYAALRARVLAGAR